MDTKLLKELQTANLLKALELRKKDDEVCKKILDYVLHEELSELQLDVTLFSEDATKSTYNFNRIK